MSCNLSNLPKVPQSMKLATSVTKSSRGFTLIELLIVITILGILSATVLPKFLSSSDFSEYTYRSDVISKLRLIQTKAMQQTTIKASADPKALCSRIVLITTNKLGEPDNCLIDGDNNGTFDLTALSFGTDDTAITGDNSEIKLRATTVRIDDKDSANITFTTSANGENFVFDNMGRPLTLDGDNLPTIPCIPCTISIIGDETVTIQIEQEGYIHAL